MADKSMCYYPFNQMLLQPNGDVSPCCWNQSVKWGNIKSNSLTEIWNSDAAVRFREEFLSGNPKSCQSQISQIGCHRWSLRDFDSEIEISAVKTQAPHRLDVRLNGKCNLECVMCDVWTQPNGVYTRTDFWSQGPIKFFPFLREIDVLGGEPFIQPDTYRLIDEISRVNKNCLWSFVTNAQYKLNHFVISKLDLISIRWLQISLDSLVRETYEIVRAKGRFDLVMETLNQFISYRQQRALVGRGFLLNVSMCVQVLNWKELGTFLDFCEKLQLGPILQFAFGPDRVSLLSLPPSERVMIFEFVCELRKKHGAVVEPIWAPLADSLKEVFPIKELSLVKGL